MRSCAINPDCPEQDWRGDDGMCGPTCMKIGALCGNIYVCPTTKLSEIPPGYIRRLLANAEKNKKLPEEDFTCSTRS